VAHLEAHPAQGTPHVTRAHGHYTRVAARTRAALEELRAATHASHAGGRDFRHSIIDVQRQALGRIREAGTYDQEVVRKVEGMLDLEEARLNS
jgi:hypothetical protein